MGVNYPNFYPQSQYANSYQSRPLYMEQQQQFQPQFQFSVLKGRPVASFDEAKASMIDFDGSIFYFPDAANKKIYTKQINLDGTSTINIYSLIEQPIETQYQNSIIEKDMVSKKEFEATINLLMQEIDKLKSAAAQPKESLKQAAPFEFNI